MKLGLPPTSAPTRTTGIGYAVIRRLKPTFGMLNFPLLCDYTRKVVKAYGVSQPDFAGLIGYTAAQRSVFVLDREGTIVYKWIADNPGIEPDYGEIEANLSELE